MPPFADAHIHIAEPGVREAYPDLEDAELLFGCSAKPDEWDALAGIRRPGLTRFYGVHPWYAGEWGAGAGDRLASILGSDASAGIGEIGLDSKRGDPDLQMRAFADQLEMASDLGRMVNIHMVGCEKRVLDALRSHGKGCGAVILHSFSAESYVKPFADMGCMFSLNPRILSRSEERIARLLDRIPSDSILLESDAPYIPKGFAGMMPFASSLGAAIGMSGEELVSIALENAGRIIHG